MDKIREKLANQTQKFKTARWITDDEADVLCKLIRKYDVSEVYESGTANGYSSCRMSETGVKVTTFDPYSRAKIWDEPGFEHYKNIVKYVEAPFSSMELNPISGIRLFFVDGDHSGLGATEDVNTILKFIDINDVIVFHDMSEKKVVKVWQRMDKSR